MKKSIWQRPNNIELAPNYVPTNYIIKTDKFDLCTIKKPIKVIN